MSTTMQEKSVQSQAVSIDRITVRSNIRKHFDESALKELAESIKDQGLINPITIRDVNGKYELVAGERRLRAAKLAGLTQIEAMIRQLTDQEALEIQTAENIHRQDITPIEEARGFQLLINSRRYDVAQLAELVNKSKVYVHRAVKLLELPKVMIDAIDAGVISAAHGHQVLRVPPEDRAVVAKWIKKDMTALALGALIDENAGRTLKGVAWDLAKEFAGMPACVTCPSNSGNQRDLFDGAAGGKCLNGGCFDKKQNEIARLQAAELTKKYPTVKLVDSAQEYEIEQRHKATDLSPAIVSKMAAAIKAKPENYIMAMVKEDDWSGGKRVSKLVPKVFVKESAKKEVLKVIGAKHNDAYKFGGGGSYSSGSSKPSVTPKQRFVRRAIWKAWMEATTKIHVPNSRAALTKILQKMEPGHYESKIPQEIAKGIKVSAGQYHGQNLNYAGMALADMLSLVLMFALDTHEIAAADFKALGINTDALKKSATTTATKAWDERKKK